MAEITRQEVYDYLSVLIDSAAVSKKNALEDLGAAVMSEKPYSDTLKKRVYRADITIETLSNVRVDLNIWLHSKGLE